MTTRPPAPARRSTALQTAQLLLAAMAAVVIALASQDWPSPAASCDAAAACNGG